MADHIFCGALTDYAADCPNSPVKGSPVNLCFHHLQQAADWYYSIVGDQQRLRATAALFFQPPDADAPAGRREPRNVVYFVRFRDLVKIGTTGNLTRRLAALTYEELLVALPGDRDTEQRLHRRFAQHRVRGEWFMDCPDIRSFISAAKRNQSTLERIAAPRR